MKIAIVENEELQAQNLQEFLHKWLQEHNVLYEIVHFKSGEEIIASKIKNFDLVFMDILMDGIDGVTTAHKLRELGFKGQSKILCNFIPRGKKYQGLCLKSRAVQCSLVTVLPRRLKVCAAWP